MSTKLNEDAMRNELAGSGFFSSSGTKTRVPPTGPTPDREPVSSAPGAEDRPTDQPADRAIGRTPGRRVINRCAFELFQDQVDQLRRISLEQKLRGEETSMSQMVREALDAYLAGKEDGR